MRLKPTVALLSLLLAVIGLAFAAVPAGSGPPPDPLGGMTVTKVVSGPVPAGTTFEVTVDCAVGGVTTLTFPEAGGTQAVPATAFTDCTLTETVDGGADETRYECQDIPRGLACKPGQVVSLGEGDAIATFTNTFVEPPPVEAPPPAAAPVTAAPTFTG